MKLAIKNLWADLSHAEVALVGILNAWAIVAAFISSIGLPAQVASEGAAVVALVALLIQWALTAPAGGLPAVLTAAVTGWAVAAGLLQQVGTPVKITSAIGAGLALAALIFQKAVVAQRARHLIPH